MVGDGRADNDKADNDRADNDRVDNDRVDYDRFVLTRSTAQRVGGFAPRLGSGDSGIRSV